MVRKHPKRKPRPGIDEYGRTKLHYACADSLPSIVAQLLAEGQNPNSQDDNGWTPLHFAAQASCFECLNLLLKAGADTELEDSNGNTPLFRAVFCSRGNGDLIQSLIDSGANPLLKNHHGVSPIDLAHTISNYDVAQYFPDIENDA